jgi:hypothetical protein
VSQIGFDMLALLVECVGASAVGIMVYIVHRHEPCENPDACNGFNRCRGCQCRENALDSAILGAGLTLVVITIVAGLTTGALP